MSTKTTKDVPSPPVLSSSSPSVIIVGAGWYGIAAAKTYLQFDPSVNLIILDADPSIGGVWGSSRVYPTLVSDSPSGLFEFFDMSLSEDLGIDMWADVDGKTVNKYLERYAQKFGVLQRCRFNTEVLYVERDGADWKLHVKNQGSISNEVLSCNKLIVATGVTSKPRMPRIDSSRFQGKVFHSHDLGQWHEYLTSDAVKNVTIARGNKSAAEAVSLCTLAGKQVTWLMRSEGRGLGILFTTRSSSGEHRAAQGASRWSSVFRPGIHARRGWLHNFLYSGKSRFGLWIQEKFWKIVTNKTIKDRQSQNPNRKLLSPETKK